MFREYLEELEEKLSPYAKKSTETLGREKPIAPCDIRTEFQRDKDRILHCKSFRRLKHKTQVFLTPDGDHYRTRLTHTLEVSQIARTIARALRLNEDLSEAISLGHDLGHTPFGHAGERVLDEITGHFAHNEQSLRIVEHLENGEGLNLTFEVRDGILNHKKGLKPITLEGVVVNFSDRIAYINHDIDDAIRAKIISLNDIPKECRSLGLTHGQRIDSMIRDIITNSFMKDQIIMSNEVSKKTDILREFMFKNVYIGSAAKVEEKKAEQMVATLYNYFLNNIDALPEETRNMIDKYGKETCTLDYISGMTDRFAIKTFSDLFLPCGWHSY